MIWLSCKFNNLARKFWRFLIVLRFAFTNDCGLVCGVETFHKLDGTLERRFVPEAGCPIHDLNLKAEC